MLAGRRDEAAALTLYRPAYRRNLNVDRGFARAAAKLRPIWLMGAKMDVAPMSKSVGAPGRIAAVERKARKRRLVNIFSCLYGKNYERFEKKPPLRGWTRLQAACYNCTTHSC